jgi:hypothetical protein
MVNPYAPSEATCKLQGFSLPSLQRSPVKRMPMMIALLLIMSTSLLAGATLGFFCAKSKGVDQDEMKNIISFFLSLAIVFGLAGTYLSYRYMAGRTPLWYVSAALGSFAVLFALPNNPSLGTVGYWLAALAACCALLATVIAGLARAFAKFDGTNSDVDLSEPHA